MIIPPEHQPYNAGEPQNAPIQHENLEYYPNLNEKVNVLFWNVYPSYDFIIGVPDPTSIRFEKEICFFGFRRSKPHKNILAFYLDINETKELLHGLQLALEESKLNSKHLWDNHKPSF